GGGALLREKIVASASARMIVIADESKRVSGLGKFPLPIEVVPFGLAVTRRQVRDALRTHDAAVALRLAKDGHPFVTDGGHFIVDAAIGPIPDPSAIAARRAAVPGVGEHGLFIGMASVVVLAGANGTRVIERP